jgi:hypothetical protein
VWFSVETMSRAETPFGVVLETTSWAETPSGVALCQFRVICVEDEPLELESLILAQNERWRQA